MNGIYLRILFSELTAIFACILHMRWAQAFAQSLASSHLQKAVLFPGGLRKSLGRVSFITGAHREVSRKRFSQVGFWSPMAPSAPWFEIWDDMGTVQTMTLIDLSLSLLCHFIIGESPTFQVSLSLGLQSIYGRMGRTQTPASVEDLAECAGCIGVIGLGRVSGKPGECRGGTSVGVVGHPDFSRETCQQSSCCRENPQNIVNLISSRGILVQTRPVLWITTCSNMDSQKETTGVSWWQTHGHGMFQISDDESGYWEVYNLQVEVEVDSTWDRNASGFEFKNGPRLAKPYFQSNIKQTWVLYF